MKGDYEEFHALRRRKNKPNSKPIAGLWPKILNETNRCQMTEHDLKKQSQFVPGRICATSFVKGDYGNIPTPRVEKNKANQSQF